MILRRLDSSKTWLSNAYAFGMIHAIAGDYTLVVITVLELRVGNFRKDGTPRDILPHNPWLVTIGVFLTYKGF